MNVELSSAFNQVLPWRMRETAQAPRQGCANVVVVPQQTSHGESQQRKNQLTCFPRTVPAKLRCPVTHSDNTLTRVTQPSPPFNPAAIHRTPLHSQHSTPFRRNPGELNFCMLSSLHMVPAASKRSTASSYLLHRPRGHWCRQHPCGPFVAHLPASAIYVPDFPKQKIACVYMC